LDQPLAGPPITLSDLDHPALATPMTTLRRLSYLEAARRALRATPPPLAGDPDTALEAVAV
jgi:hypothetical protein